MPDGFHLSFWQGRVTQGGFAVKQVSRLGGVAVADEHPAGETEQGLVVTTLTDSERGGIEGGEGILLCLDGKPRINGGGAGERLNVGCGVSVDEAGASTATGSKKSNWSARDFFKPAYSPASATGWMGR